MEWTILIQLLMTMLNECLDKENDQTVARRSRAQRIVRNPLRLRAAVTRALRQYGIHGVELQKQREEICEYIQDATDAEIGDFLESSWESSRENEY